MKPKAVILVGLLAGLACALAYSMLVIVDESEYVVVTRFGRIVAVHGDQPGESGPRLKAPWESAWPVDRRLRVLDSPPREVITGDKRNLEAATYLVWRVIDPVVFLRGSGTREAAEARLEERAWAALSDSIGRHDLSALASTDPGQFALDALLNEVRDQTALAARDELGVEVVDVRLRRFSHPLEVRPAVFELIRGERRQVAARLRAEGEANSTKIVSQADRARDEILSAAEADAERSRGQAEAEAARILNQAHAQDPKFFEFLRTLESYRSILDGRATLVLSASSPLLRLLSQGPGALDQPPSPTSSPTPPVVKNAARTP